jgi:hypothetical protein
MGALLKFAIVLVSGVAIGFYLNGSMSLERAANLARIGDTNILVGNAHTTPEAAAIVVDPADAGRVDEDLVDQADAGRVEDLDYLIAKQIGTLEGWQAFLAAHASGAHAESAEAEIDKLSLLVKSFERAAAQVSDRLPAAPPLHEVCNHDGDCPGGPPSEPSSDEITRIANEPEPGTPKAASLTDGSATATDQPNSSTKVAPELGSKPRVIAPRRRTGVSSHIIPRRREQPCGFRFECHWKTQTLPPIVLALLGIKTKHSTRAFGQMRLPTRGRVS